MKITEYDTEKRIRYVSELERDWCDEKELKKIKLKLKQDEVILGKNLFDYVMQDLNIPKWLQGCIDMQEFLVALFYQNKLRVFELEFDELSDLKYFFVYKREVKQ